MEFHNLFQMQYYHISSFHFLVIQVIQKFHQHLILLWIFKQIEKSLNFNLLMAQLISLGQILIYSFNFSFDSQINSNKFGFIKMAFEHYLFSNFVLADFISFIIIGFLNQEKYLQILKRMEIFFSIFFRLKISHINESFLFFLSKEFDLKLIDI